MADSPSKTDAVPIVTLRTLLGAGSVESPGLEAALAPEQQKAIDRYDRVLEKLQEDTTHPIVRPPDDTVATLADKGRVAVVGDWGTNLYGAPVSAASINRAGGYELLLHLGDIYYSGTRIEAKQRFLDVWPTSAGKVSRALNGNHEMYSGGFAYFDDILPTLSQPSSYFALQNTDWLLVGLDTAHTDQGDTIAKHPKISHSAIYCPQPWGKSCAPISSARKSKIRSPIPESIPAGYYAWNAR